MAIVKTPGGRIKTGYSGQVFGRWTVQGEAFPVRSRVRSHFKVVCQCDCGNVSVVQCDNLTSGASTGCCDCQLTHGRSGDRIYTVWSNMWGRCVSPNNISYKHYGGRGITVCDRWRDFEAFVDDMGEPPEGSQIDRIDNDGNYEPGNCRWTTRVENARNKRSNRVITIGGVEKCLAEWSRESGVSVPTIIYRLRNGVCPHDAVFTKPRRQLGPLTINGITKSASGWSKVSGVSAATICKRVKLGWHPKDAVFLTPTQRKV